ncbi:hypothetical protein CBX57_021395 [Salmonella enterica]|nr:hypothetical protein [Salmonella enterica]
MTIRSARHYSGGSAGNKVNGATHAAMLAIYHRVFLLNAALKRANSITFFAPAKVTIPLA